MLFTKLTKKEKITIIFLILIGAISEPLIAYSYILLENNIRNMNDINFIHQVLKILCIIIFSLLLAGINYIGVDLLLDQLVTNIREKIFKKIMYKSSSELYSNDKTIYYNDILKKIEFWKYRYAKSLLILVEKSLQIFFVLLFISIINIKITIFVVIFLIPLVLNNVIFPKKMEKNYKEYLKKDENLLSKMKEYFDAILIIKNNNEEDEYLSKMNTIFDEQNKYTKYMSKLDNLSAIIANSGVVLLQISGIIISLYFYQNSYITIGMFLAVIQLTFFINQPVIALINSLIGIKSMKSINEHITTLLKNEEKESIKNKEMIFSEIIFKNVNYEYRSNKKVFDSDISIKLEHNKKYLIIGESGRGKSTLVKILMKYLKNYKGSIKINGIELNELHDNDINENIFYIPQNLYIFNESINDNLNIKKKHSEKEVVEVLKYMNLEKIIKDEGLDTVIGQEINSVSGG